MLDKIRQLMSQGARRGADWDGVAAWAEAASLVFKRARGGDGFAVEGSLGEDYVPWRLEWGPSKRFYFDSNELRIRAELGLPDELQMLVMSRALMRRLESETFHTLTDSLKITRKRTLDEPVGLPSRRTIESTVGTALPVAVRTPTEGIALST